jgi:hypothetical protein
VQQKHQWFDMAIVLDYSPNYVHLRRYHAFSIGSCFESVVSREKVGQNEHPAIITHKNQSRRGSSSAAKKATEYVGSDAAAAGATEAFYP